MAVLQSGPINTSEYQRSAPEGTPLPPGLYKGIVTKTEQKETADNGSGAGTMLVVEFDITWPEEFSNRKFWDQFNIINASATTVGIALGQLADLGKAAGFSLLEDDEQLQGQEVVLELYVEAAKPYVDKKTGQPREGKAKNRCKKYWHVDTDMESVKKGQKVSAPVAAPAPRPVSATPMADAPAAKPAWGGQKPAAPAPVAPPAQQQAAPASNAAPWKRAK